MWVAPVPLPDMSVLHLLAELEKTLWRIDPLYQIIYIITLYAQVKRENYRSIYIITLNAQVKCENYRSIYIIMYHK